VRAPFHVEIKIDQRGPCLIDAGARLVGNRNAFVCEELHGKGFDPFDLACRSYLSPVPAPPPRMDWDSYDATELLYVQGLATRAGRFYARYGARRDEFLSVVMLFPALPEERHGLREAGAAQPLVPRVARAFRLPGAAADERPRHPLREKAFLTCFGRFRAQYEARRVTNE
jgi:hypothetical protein